MGVHIRRGGFYPALFLSSIFLLSIFKIKSYDLWWHIKAGEFIVGAGLKPAPTNTFSWVEPGHPWVNFSWIFDIIVYSIYNTAGFNGLIIFQAILITAVFFAVYKTLVPSKTGDSPDSTTSQAEVRKSGTVPMNLLFLLFLIAYFAARFRFSLRPHLLALLFFAIDIYLLNRLSAISSQRSAISLSHWERARVRVPFAGVMLIQIFWANVHGSAIVGVLLPAIFAIGHIVGRAVPADKGQVVGVAHPTVKAVSPLKSYVFLVFLSLLASLLNPYGYHILADSLVPFLGKGYDLFQMLAIDEWQMPSKEMFFGWYGLLLAIGIMSFLWQHMYGRGNLDRTDIFLFLIFAILSIKAVRFIDLFAVAAVPVIFKNIVGSREPGVGSRSRVGFAQRRILSFSIIALFWFIGIKDTTFTLGFGVDEEVVPKKAVELMGRSGIRGRIFNSYNFGGYLIYKGYPVFIDGRLCYSKGLITEFADANLYPPHPDPLPKGERVEGKGWRKVDKKYRPDIVLVEYAKPSIPTSLLMDRENWALIYWDDLAMLFLRRNQGFSDIIDRNEYRYLNPMDMYGLLPSPQPSPRGRGSKGEGEGHPSILSPLWGEGQGEGIFSEARRRVKEDAESMRAHLLLGNLYMSRGEADKAAAEYKTVIKSSLSFGKAEAHNNLGSVYERIGDVDSAEMEYKRAIGLDKTYPLPQRNIGYLKLEQSEYIEALWHLDRYLRLDKGDKNTLSIIFGLKRYRDALILKIFIGGGAIIGIIWIVARNLCRGNS